MKCFYYVIASDWKERSNLWFEGIYQRLLRRPEYRAPRNDKRILNFTLSFYILRFQFYIFLIRFHYLFFYTLKFYFIFLLHKFRGIEDFN